VENVTDTMDRIASTLEGHGLYREAMAVDVLSNTIDSASSSLRSQPSFGPLGGPRYNTMPSPPGDSPGSIDEIVDKHQAQTDKALATISSGVTAFLDVLNKIVSEHPDLSQIVQKHKVEVARLHRELEVEMRDSLMLLLLKKGGLERSMQSVDRRGG
jgi:hypothetical protein